MNEKFDIEHFPTSETAIRMMSRISPIYERAYVGKWIFQVMGAELDDVRLRFDELKDQAFPETATWGLKYWEQRYGITPSEGQSLEERRRAVLSTRKVREPMNPARLERIIKTMTGMDAKVTEDVAPYTFTVEIENNGQPLDFDAVMGKIKRVKPSHQRVIMYMTTRVGIQIKPRREAYRIPYPLAGTHPDTNIVGVLTEEAIQIGTEGTPVVGLPMTGEHNAGTVPDTNTVGAFTDAPLRIESEGAAVIYPSPMTGEYRAGTAPQEAMAGAYADGGVEEATGGSTFTIDYPMCGEN